MVIQLMTEHKQDFSTEKCYPDRSKIQKVVCCQNTIDNKLKYFGSANDWYLNDIPSTVKVHAVKDFWAAWKITSKKTNSVMKIKDEECLKGGTFGIEKCQCRKLDDKHISFYHKHGIGKMKLISKLLFNLEHDVKMYRNPRGKYYLMVPIPLEKRPMKAEACGSIAGIDPGVRTFATVYDPSHCKVMQYGVADDFLPCGKHQGDQQINDHTAKHKRKKRREARKRVCMGYSTRLK